jgi:hypothetical protein
MNDLKCKRNPIRVSRDAGYNKMESISPENLKKVRQKRNNGDIMSRIDLLDELYSKMGIIVRPDRMTNWYAFTD